MHKQWYRRSLRRWVSRRLGFSLYRVASYSEYLGQRVGNRMERVGLRFHIASER